MTERRRVQLLVPSADAARLVVDADGRVPAVDLEFDGEAGLTTAAALHAALAELGDGGAVAVDYLIDQTDQEDDVAPVAVVAEVEWPGAPGPWRWVPVADAVVDAIAPLQPYVDARLAEWAGAPVPAHRSPWVRRGWLAELREWIDSELDEAFGVRATAVVPFRSWGISSVHRVESTAGTFWAKAVFDGFAAEPAITDLLGRLVPGSVPRVVATDTERGWLLTAHLPGSTVGLRPERTDDAIRALVHVQRQLAEHLDDLRAAGAADRPLHTLADDLRDVLGDEPGDVADAAALVEAVRAAVRQVDALGLPDTIAHGDFHPANVMVDGDTVVVFDWSDAARSNPLVDVGAWVAWFRDEPATVDTLWRTWWASWGLSDAALAPTRPALDAVVAAYHVVSYRRIGRGLETLRAGEATYGADRFLADLRAAVSAL